MHVHHYREPEVLRDKRVLVLGIGNSATDVAVEASRIAEEDLPGDAARRLRHAQVPATASRPTRPAIEAAHNDAAAGPALRSSIALLRLTAGDMTAYGLPEPDHKLLEAHPTVSAEMLSRLGHGDIAVKPNIERFAGGRTVRFVDGSEEEIDLVVYCTGYKISFPFFDEGLVARHGQPAAALPAGRLGRASRGCTSSASSSRWGRSCRSPRRRRNGSADLLGGRGHLPAGGGDAGRRSSATEEKMREAVRRLQASHDPGGLPALPARGSGGSGSGLAQRVVTGGRRTVGCPSWLLGFSPGGLGCAAEGLGRKPGRRCPAGAPRRASQAPPLLGPLLGASGAGGGAPALEAAVGVVGCASGSGALAGPPDQPEGAQDWDLQDDQEKEDWPEPLHRGSV